MTVIIITFLMKNNLEMNIIRVELNHVTGTLPRELKSKKYFKISTITKSDWLELKIGNLNSDWSKFFVDFKV